MFFIDSWIWIEFFIEGKLGQLSKDIINKIGRSKALINPLVLCEIQYRLSKRIDPIMAKETVEFIESIDNLYVVPITAEIAKYAAELRYKYYTPGKKELSYADTIHLSTAIKTGCEKLYSGDPDFKNIQEIKTEIIR